MPDDDGNPHPATPWPEPMPGEYEAWLEMVNATEPIWQRLPETSVLRVVCEALYAAFADYYAGRREPPTLRSTVVGVLAIAGQCPYLVG
jgi:hypothetical protein